MLEKPKGVGYRSQVESLVCATLSTVVGGKTESLDTGVDSW